jgi:hypothetical protein
VGAERPAITVDLAPQGAVDPAHPPHPGVLESVMCRPEQNVEAEGALEERRRGDRGAGPLRFAYRDPDHPILSLEEQLPGES